MLKAEFSSILEQMDSLIWGYHLPVPHEVAEDFKKQCIKRVICEVNGELQISSAILSTNGYYYILINKQNVKKLGLIKGEPVSISISEDTSKYGMPLASELKEVFEQEPEAIQYFETLLPGKQRNLLHLVNKVKNTDSRIRKSLAIAHHLKEVKGKLDFKLLNETIIEYNQLKW